MSFRNADPKAGIAAARRAINDFLDRAETAIEEAVRARTAPVVFARPDVTELALEVLEPVQHSYLAVGEWAYARTSDGVASFADAVADRLEQGPPVDDIGAWLRAQAEQLRAAK